MTKLQQIESSVKELTGEELATFRAWFDEYDAAAWDKQFEADVEAGQLDKLADQAIRDFEAGRCKEL